MEDSKNNPPLGWSLSGCQAGSGWAQEHINTKHIEVIQMNNYTYEFKKVVQLIESNQITLKTINFNDI